ncbi:MAG: hypothetical protein Tsb0034_25330 [Ekhidna sp.]
MKTNEILVMDDQRVPLHIRTFIEAIEQLDMQFTSASLENIYRSDRDMEMAIARAMRVCRNIGLPLERHFRRRYLANSSQHTLQTDWKMSKVAYCLALVNGNPDNPMVGRIQWELLRKMV